VAEGLPAALRASELSDRYRDAATAIRSRTDTSVKALGAIGTAAVTAIGYAELADIYPNGGPWWAPPVLIVGVLVMIAAVILLVRRFQGIGETIVTTSDVGETCRLNRFGRAEEATFVSTYRHTARLNGVDTLRAYLARAHRFERLAERAATEEAASLREQADLITAEVRATQDRASLFILRDKAKAALFSPATAFFLLLFVVGWYGTALASDAMENKRSGEFEVQKNCLELREKAAGAPLPSLCAELVPKKPEEKPKPSGTKVAVEAVPAIAKLWSECRQAAAEAKESEAACAPLMQALEASKSGVPPG
jgi:hypothetical protein